ncbi:MAG: thiamine phosphate synthase [bacterium]
MDALGKIYVVTDRKAAGEQFFEILENLIASGLTFIQLREKDLPAAELYSLGKKIQKLGKKRGLKLVINDRIDVAVALNAYGVQLTERSLTPDIVKRITKNLKVGLSVHDEERIKRFERYVDFFLFGNVFDTESKPGLIGKGVFAVKKIVGLTDKPLYAIGGINSNNMQIVFRAGAYGVAMRGCFFSNQNYREEIVRIKETLKNTEGVI